MPFFWITTLLIAGILCASIKNIPGDVWLWMTFVFLGVSLAAFTLKRRSLLRAAGYIFRSVPGTRLPYLLLPIFFFLGGSLYQAWLPDMNRNSLFSLNNSGQVLEISGKVASLPDERETLTLVEFQASSFRYPLHTEMPTRERLMVFLRPDQDVEYGDTLRLSGKPITPRETADFSYREYLAGQQIFTQVIYPEVVERTPSDGGIGKALFGFKEKSLQLLDRIYPAPEASLVKGILLGDDSDIPDEIAQAFRASGTSHLIAISGFNIAIVANLVTLLFAGWFGKFKGAIGATIAIGLYTILVGANPPVVRAAIMGCIGIYGNLIGRRNGGANALFLTCGIMLALNPFLLWSISFQLSAGATLGLVLFASPIEKWVKSWVVRITDVSAGKKIGQYVSEYVFFTLAALIPILPMLLHHFHQVPLATFIANPLVLPVQPLLMITSAASLALGWIHPGVGGLAANLSLPLISLTIRVVEWAAGLSIPSITAPSFSFGLIGFWVVVISLPAALPAFGKIILNAWKPVFAVVGMVFIALSSLHLAVDRPDGKLHVFISGSHGEQIVVIKTPDSRSVLVNTGTSQNELLSFLDGRLPFSNRRLDLVVLPPDVASLEISAGVSHIIPMNQIVVIGSATGFEEVAGDFERESDVSFLPAGGIMNTDSGVFFSVEPASNEQISTRIKWGQFDVNIVNGKTKLPVPCSGGIMILADRGIPLSDSCLPQVLLSPDKEIIRANQVDLYRTGWVHLTTDGSNLWMESQK